MFLSRLLAFCSLAVLANALPRDQISFGFNYPYQVISNNPDSSDLETVVPAQSPGEAVTKSQQLTSPHLTGVSADAVVELISGFDCKNRLKTTKVKVPVDTCLQVQMMNNAILRVPPACADGTPAKWNLYSDIYCSLDSLHHNVAEDFSSPNGDCLWIGPLVSSIGFWCDGIKVEGREEVDHSSISNEPDNLSEDNLPLSVKIVSTESVPARLSLGKEGSDATASPGESDPAQFDPAPAQSLPCIGPWCKGRLHLIDTCNKNFFNQRTTVPIDHCFNIPQPYNPQGSVMITKPAICLDGTYAKLAVYEGQGCSSMLINTQLHENDTDLCLSTFGWRWGLQTTMTSLKPLCKDSPEYNISLARNASLNLFAASTKPVQNVNEGGCSGTFNSLSLPADTCLSGDYYLSYNMIMAQIPVCANGQHPVLLYYNARGCVGTTRYLSGWGSYASTSCLWSAYIYPQARYWSMIWRCGYFPYPPTQPAPPVPQGAKFHQLAIAPPAPCRDAPKSAVVIPCSPCNSSEVSRNEIIVLPTGDCLATPGDGIEILSHGVCENGTRAQWARFEDENCGGGTISSRYGLVDIPDRYQPPDVYLDKCLSTGVEDGEKIRSVAFWCDGLRSGNEDYEVGTPSEPYIFPQAKAHHLDM